MLLHMLAAVSTATPGGLLDKLEFFDDGVSGLSLADEYGPAVLSQTSLNQGLWAAMNVTAPESPFSVTVSVPGHPLGHETVLNFSAAASCTKTWQPTPKGFVPTSQNDSVLLSTAMGISHDQCVSMCCTTINCKAWTWDVNCAIYTEGYGLVKAAASSQAVGGYLTGAPSTADQVVNGLRSGTYLGGAGTGGYELRADGKFYLSTIRGQSPASEPWQGTVRDAILASVRNPP